MGRLDRLSAICMIVCTVFFALVVADRFLPRASAASARAMGVHEPEWRSFLGSAIRVGEPDAPIAIVEFVDFECPSCAAFSRALKSVESARDVVLYFVHYPLAQHRFAMQAANAIECAEERGRFSQMSEAIFTQQRLLGIKEWSTLAEEAGLESDEFLACMREEVHLARIEAGREAGDRLGIRATPTVLVNGWRFDGALSEAQLVAILDGIRGGEITDDEASRKVISAIVTKR